MPKWGAILDASEGPNVANRALLRGRQEVWRQRRRCDNRREPKVCESERVVGSGGLGGRDLKMLQHMFEEGAQHKHASSLQKLEKARKQIVPPKASRRNTALPMP